MAKYLLLDPTDCVVNIIEWDGKAPWNPPRCHRLVPHDGPAWHGARWDGQKVIDPNPPPATAPNAPVKPMAGGVSTIG